MKYDVFIDDVVLQGQIKVEADSKKEAEDKSRKLFDSMLQRAEARDVYLGINNDDYVKRAITTMWYALGEDDYDE